MIIHICLVFMFISTVYGCDAEPAQLRVYRTSIDDYRELPLENGTEILSIPWFDCNRTTVFFCHGWKGSATGPTVILMIKALLNLGGCNVVLINWEKLAADPFNNPPIGYSICGVPNALQLGCDIADTVISMIKAGLDINKIHIMGHSLCAHAMGVTGNKMKEKGFQLPRITGLDPAGNIFNVKLPDTTLNSNSAGFVDVLHCDLFKYGSIRSMGSVDFWPNCYGDQPGCNHSLKYEPFSPEDLCNHNKCVEYFAYVLPQNSSELLGRYANNYVAWKYFPKEDPNITLEIGKFDPEAKPGNYFLRTNPVPPPFGLGYDGSKP